MNFMNKEQDKKDTGGIHDNRHERMSLQLNTSLSIQAIKDIISSSHDNHDDNELCCIAENDANRARVVAAAIKEAYNCAKSTKNGHNTNNQDWDAACMMIIQNKILTCSEKSTIVALLRYNNNNGISTDASSVTQSSSVVATPPY
ncbi:13259_t:CDS:2 [Entrophospora sp. SA101]|nr:13259_t:CDS:2 [Entrophospora sp. SA101]